VLIERPATERREDSWIGRAYFQAPQVDSVTHVETSANIAPGDLVRCTITGSDGYDLIARPSAELTHGSR
jgi:hypothetical protein